MTRKPNRNGFSLLELLVVIALLAILAALAAGTYFRITNAQRVTSTESTLQKLSVGLDNLYSAERDRIDKEFNTSQLQHASMDRLLGFAGGPNERDRARAIWMYFRLKNEFPQTFPEAVSPTNLVALPASLVFSLPPRQTFLNPITGTPNPPPAPVVSALAPATAEEANLQAAALLYLILSEKASRGAGFDLDAVNAFSKEITLSGRPFRVFIDSWGTPISYVRFLTSTEIDSPPYSRNLPGVFNNANNLPINLTNNPLDPKVRLISSGWPNFASFVSSGGIVTQIPGVNRQEQILRRNWTTTVISAGPNRQWDMFDARGRNPTAPFANIGIVEYGIPGTEADDNMFGYRLRRFGARGD